ncbi:MAG: hypothetical protein AAGH89_04810 [Verrucomicrobiota bacterium]
MAQSAPLAQDASSLLNSKESSEEQIRQLAKLGRPAAAAIIELFKEDQLTQEKMEAGRLARKVVSNHKKAYQARIYKAEQLVKAAVGTPLEAALLELLAEKALVEPNSHDYTNALAIMGPSASPTLAALAADIGSKADKTLEDYHRIRNIANMIGPAIGDTLDLVIPERYNSGTWNDERNWINASSATYPYWKKFDHPDWYGLAHASPSSKHIPAFLDLVENPELMRARWYEGIHRVGMILSGMGDAAVLPVAELLNEESMETRWSAATLLSMIGPRAKPAAPALQKALADEK